MNAPEPAVAVPATPRTTDLFTTVPAVTLPDGTIVPSFRVGTYVCTQGADGKAAVTAEGAPWVRINFEEAKAACIAAGYTLITELQWLAIAWDVARQDCNWTKGKVGEGKLFRGLRKDTVSSAQPGTFESPDPKERRWLTLSNGERICDINGNVFQWVFDNIQGDSAGLTTVIDARSMTLQAPFPSLEKGMGWRPEGERDWSGRALIRGGYWYSVSNAGVFILDYDWPDHRLGLVGFRCTDPHGL
jgi:formylglycine-generating enzyme required for sulfatase activity